MSTFLLPREIRARDLARPAALASVLALGFVIVLRLAVRGTLPQGVAAITAPATLLLLVAATFRLLVVLGPCAVDERGAPRDLLRRHGFWVVALGTCLALPALGSSGLVDPWETHYAEVAREMIERRDFVSPWWANEGWFFSKPVLLFWLEACSMIVLGVRTGPDAVLAGGAHPEWAVRFPAFACALLGTYALYHGVSRTVGRRAGAIGAVVLWTSPGFALLSHQGMTDMPLVAGVAASLGLFLRALATNDARETRPHVIAFGRRSLTLHAGRALAALFVAASLAQVMLFVVSRSGAGSPHACGLPGQPACVALRFAHPRLGPLVQASFFAPIVAWIAMHVAEERRVSRLYALAAWGCAAFATMAKGPAGLVLPVFGCVLAAWTTDGLRAPRALLRLAPLAGAGLAAALVVPWYVAAWARHGQPFIDELVMRHMLGRAIDHLHDTNDGEDVGLAYYVRQLGYATFPWSGIVAAAVLAAPEKRDDASHRTRARALLFGTAVGGFVLVSWMRTKFHHYALVLLPALAMLAGLFADELLARARSTRGRARAAWSAVVGVAIALATALVGLDVARSPARFVLLLTYRYTRAWPSTRGFALLFAIVAGCTCFALVAFAVRRLRARAFAVVAALAFGLAAVLVDAYLPCCAADGGQRGIFEAYYRERPPGAHAPLVAYQLNWKGENFYSGNDVAIFVSSGAPFRTYLDRRRAREDDRTLYVVTERDRVHALRAEIGATRSFVELTGPDVSSEFVLVRAEL